MEFQFSFFPPAQNPPKPTVSMGLWSIPNEGYWVEEYKQGNQKKRKSQYKMN